MMMKNIKECKWEDIQDSVDEVFALHDPILDFSIGIFCDCGSVVKLLNRSGIEISGPS